MDRHWPHTSHLLIGHIHRGRLALEWGVLLSCGGKQPRTVLNVLGIFVKHFKWHKYSSYSTSAGDGVEMPLVDKCDDDEDEHNCCWVVAYLQEHNMHSVVDLREHRKTFQWFDRNKSAAKNNEIQQKRTSFYKGNEHKTITFTFGWLTKNKMYVWLQSIDPGRVSEAVNSFYRQKISLICEQNQAVNHDILTCGFGTKGRERYNCNNSVKFINVI